MLFGNVIDKPFDLLWLGKITSKRKGRQSFALHRFCCFVKSLLVGTDQDHRRARLEQSFGNRVSKSTSRTRDDGDIVLQ